MIHRPGTDIAQGGTVLQQGAAAYSSAFGDSQEERDRYDAMKAAIWYELQKAREGCRASENGIKAIDEQLANIALGTPADVIREFERNRDENRRNLAHLQLNLQSLCNRMATDFGELHTPDW